MNDSVHLRVIFVNRFFRKSLSLHVLAGPLLLLAHRRTHCMGCERLRGADGGKGEFGKKISQFISAGEPGQTSH